MSSGPAVSVIMPAYNSESTIVAAIESVQRQSETSWELIVVDDGSRDETSVLVGNLCKVDNRIRLVHTSPNSGRPGLARNLGLDAARGEWIAFLDSDDVWRPDKLAVQMASCIESGARISCTGYAVMGQPKAIFRPREWSDFWDLVKLNQVACSSALVHRDALGDKRFRACGHEDYDLWLALVRGGERIYGLQEVLLDYSTAGGTVSSNPTRNLASLAGIYRNTAGFGPLTSVVLAARYGARAVLRFGWSTTVLQRFVRTRPR